MSQVHALKLAAEVTRKALADREISPERFDSLHLGYTIPQTACFYGAPWVAALIGAEGITGPIYSQACATGARTISGAASEVENGLARCVLALTADRCSNGPHLVYPQPGAPGGKPETEDWVWDNFGRDPWAGQAMINTAENVAAEAGISREEQDACALIRYEQYTQALANDGKFHRRYVVSPVEVNPSGRKVVATLTGDEGVFPTTAEGLAKIRPMVKDGTVTFGSQTHPADGNAGMVITTRELAKELSRDDSISVQILAAGTARTKKGYMAMAVVPAARQACQRADVQLDQCVIKTHNPFAVNDVYFARETGVKLESFNNFGSSLVYGHPQAPTGMRLVAELIEELVMNGGGYGLFAGCAAGDTAMALVLKVDM